MSVLEVLGVRPAADRAHETLRELVDGYFALALPFETISNIETDTLVKTPGQIAEALSAGFGGHCLEHAILLHTMLTSAGFEARLVHADQNDFLSKVFLDHTQSYVLVSMGEERVIVDPFLTQRIYPCPRAGGQVDGDALVQAVVDAAKIRMTWWEANGRVTREELVHLDEPEDARAALMRERYRDLSPFGVLSPFYREVRPLKRSIVYFPATDTLLIREGDGSRHISPGALDDERWIPTRLRARIPACLARVRERRAEYLRFLHHGMVSPFQRALSSRN